MLTSNEFDSFADQIIALYTEYEESVICDIARRLGSLEMTSTAAWQMQRLVESGAVYENAIKELAKLTSKSESELKSIFQEAGVKAIRFDDSIYQKAGLQPVPLNLSPAMAQVLAAGLRKTNQIMRNMTMTTALSGQNAFVKAADLAYLQVSTGAMSYNQAITDAVKRVAADGLSTIQYASGRTDQLDVAVRRTLLTGVSQTTGELQLTRADEMGCDLVQTSAHAGARPTHEIWQGRVFSKSGKTSGYPSFIEATGYGTAGGLCGVNCVLGDTFVSGSTPSTVYRRKYSGEIIILRTASGKELSVTPNHPILTDKGWIAAGLLAKGDNVISRSNFNGVSRTSPDPHQNEARIEDIFNSFAQSGDVMRLPASAGYFHGDISNGEVDTVFPQSFLRNGCKPSFVKQKIKIAFGRTPKFLSFLTPNSSMNEILFCSDHPTNSIMSVLSKFGTSIRPHFFQSIVQCFRTAGSQLNAHFGKVSPNQTFGNSNLGGNFVFPEPGIIHGEQFFWGNSRFSHQIGFPISRIRNAISLQAVLNGVKRAAIFVGDKLICFPREKQIENIVFIERKYLTSTHVYNLETKNGWYYANGIITHNCRHSFYPFFEGISENAYSEKARNELAARKVVYNGQEMSLYNATQYQRGVERKIRYWKRQAGALEAAGMDNSAERLKLGEWQARMRDFTKQTKLIRQSEREQVNGLGNVRALTKKIAISPSVEPVALSNVGRKIIDVGNTGTSIGGIIESRSNAKMVRATEDVLSHIEKHKDQFDILKAKQMLPQILNNPKFIYEGKKASSLQFVEDFDEKYFLMVPIKYLKDELWLETLTIEEKQRFLKRWAKRILLYKRE